MTAQAGSAPGRTSRWPAVVVALLGLAFSLALEVVHYNTFMRPAASSFCAVGETLDCASVAVSRYSVLLGVPLPLWGVVGFMALLAAAWQRSRWLLPLAAVATLASVALLAIELVAIGAVCLLCEGVHVAALLLLVIAWRSRHDAQGAFTNRDDALVIFAPALGLLVAFLLFVKPYWGSFHWKGEVPFATGKTEEGFPWIGAENPELVVHEFTDYACPHCRAASSAMLRRVAQKQDKLRIVRRQFPRMPCPQGSDAHCQAVRAAFCAEEQGKFWQADRWLFEHSTGTHEVDRVAMSRDLALDQSKLSACMAREDIYARGQQAHLFAVRKRLPGTPYYIVGGKLLSAEKVAELIEAL